MGVITAEPLYHAQVCEYHPQGFNRDIVHWRNISFVDFVWTWLGSSWLICQWSWIFWGGVKFYFDLEGGAQVNHIYTKLYRFSLQTCIIHLIITTVTINIYTKGTKMKYNKQLIFCWISNKIVTQRLITSLNHLTFINLYHVCFCK